MKEFTGTSCERQAGAGVQCESIEVWRTSNLGTSATSVRTTHSQSFDLQLATSIVVSGALAYGFYDDGQKVHSVQNDT
jgi:hypothetical protein